MNDIAMHHCHRAYGVWALYRNVGLTIRALAGWAQASASRIDEKQLAIEGDAGSFKTSWNFKRPEPDLLLATLTICAPWGWPVVVTPKDGVDKDFPTRVGMARMVTIGCSSTEHYLSTALAEKVREEVTHLPVHEI